MWGGPRQNPGVSKFKFLHFLQLQWMSNQPKPHPSISDRNGEQLGDTPYNLPQAQLRAHDDICQCSWMIWSRVSSLEESSNDV